MDITYRQEMRVRCLELALELCGQYRNADSVVNVANIFFNFIDENLKQKEPIPLNTLDSPIEKYTS
jgi:hypothetical protein